MEIHGTSTDVKMKTLKYVYYENAFAPYKLNPKRG